MRSMEGKYRPGTLILTEEDVRRCVGVSEAAAIVEELLKSEGEKRWTESRNSIPLHGTFSGNRVILDVSHRDGSDTITSKVTASFPSNSITREAPVNPSLISLFDSKNGRPLMVIGAGPLQTLITSAITAVAAKYLARTKASILTIIGAGDQGRSNTVATDQVLKLSRVKVYDIRKERALAFVDEVEKSINVEVVASDSVQEAVQGADVVVTTTTADEPLIKASWLEPGVFLAKIGSYQELELEVLLQVDKLVVDNWDYVSRRSKEITTLMQKGVLSKENTYLLPEIVAGKVKGRESDEERILLIHLGFAAKYGATGPYVYNRAIELGLGRWLPQLW